MASTKKKTKTVSLKLSSKLIKINRQGGGTDNFYASWSFTTSQKKKKITKKVYNAKSKKKDKRAPKDKLYTSVIDSYTVKWYYKVSTDKKSVWYLDKTITGVKSRNTSSDLWSPPANAMQLKVTVQPISKTYKSSANKESKWFTVSATEKIDKDYDEVPSTPSIGTFSIDGKKLTAQVIVDLTDFDRLETCAVRLQILKNSKSLIKDGNNYYIEKKYPYTNSSGDKVYLPSTGIVNFEYTLTGVGSYQVRGAVASYDGGYKWSEYSSWSSSVDTRPNAPTISSIKAIDEDKVKISWNSVLTAKQYTIEYVSDSTAYFDSGMAQSTNVDNLTSYIITGLEAGHVWYFRVRSVNDADKSDPSNIVSIVMATKPSPPSTWSSASTTSIDSTIGTTEPVYLYWIHNSVDGSAQRNAKFEFEISGKKYYLIKENTEKDDHGELIDTTSSIELWSTTVYTSSSSNTGSAGTIYSIFKKAGAESIKWKVRTKGIHADYSDWSTERVINAYMKPNLKLYVLDSEGAEFPGNVISAFPICIKGTVTPSSQTPISFHVSIITNETYDTTDIYGDEITVPEGTEVYSRYIDENTLDYQIGASDVDFVSGVSYVMTVIVYTDEGLNAEAKYTFSPDWEESGEEPQAYFDYNETYRYVDITPSCSYFIGYEPEEGSGLEDYNPVVYFGTSITGAADSPTVFSGSGIESAVAGDMYFNKSTYEVYACTASGDASTATWIYRTTFKYEDAVNWYAGTSIDGESDDYIYPSSGVLSASLNDYYLNTDSGDIFRCVKSGTPTSAVWAYIWNCFWEVTPNISLSIYRREQNGSYVTIAEGIDNAIQSSDDALSFRDYHPSFNTCVYRIVATNTENGGIGYTDLVENYAESSVVIQWDEKWNDISKYSDSEEEVFEGSILELPANIKLSDRNSNDVTLAEYIGRSRPVSYYGTQRGENPSISCEFPKSDTDKLTLLRRLMAYQGDVYIREPSGLGYWANVTVSYDRNSKELTIPVSIEIKPVEGGV